MSEAIEPGSLNPTKVGPQGDMNLRFIRMPLRCGANGKRRYRRIAKERAQNTRTAARGRERKWLSEHDDVAQSREPTSILVQRIRGDVAPTIITGNCGALS